MMELLGLPVQASTHAQDLDHMTLLVHWMMAVLFVGWGAFFIFVLARFRQRANPRASYAGANFIHRLNWKYMGWLQGYNGGPLRLGMRVVVQPARHARHFT